MCKRNSLLGDLRVKEQMIDMNSEALEKAINNILEAIQIVATAAESTPDAASKSLNELANELFHINAKIGLMIIKDFEQ